MSDPIGLFLVCLALCAVPGPTNALLAAAGAGRGWRGALPAVPAAVAGYAVAIVTLVGLAGPAVAAAPLVAATLKAAAGLFLVRSAVGLWAGGRVAAGPPAPGAPGAGAVFVTTFLNPKALVLAFGVLPRRPLPDLFAPDLLLVGFAVALTAAAWVAAGALVAGDGGRWVTPARLSRAAAVVLAGFAAMLAADAGGAIAGVLV